MERFDEFEYSQRDMIGHGAFAIVYKGRYIHKPEVPVAIKCISKKNIQKSKNLLRKEIEILKELAHLKHENLVALLRCTETATHVFLVMEFCNGGDLGDYLQTKGTLKEDTIHHFVVQIARAMEAMNGKGIVHRDLKPQNILLCNPTKKPNPPATDFIVKLADFGFARFLSDGVMAATLCGSPMYMAPEVIMSLQYDAKADLWSIGTILFQCLVGRAPFQAQTPPALKMYYERHKDLRPDIPAYCSSQLKDLLIRLLTKNARDRIAFDEFFNHPFLHHPPPVSPSKRILDTSPSPIAARRIGGSGLPLPRSRPSNPVPPSPTSTTLTNRMESHLPVGRNNVAPTAMNESAGDFTFLPPLPGHNQGSSPVKQVQVHTGEASSLQHYNGQQEVRAVPVPSQRQAYAAIQKRRGLTSPRPRSEEGEEGRRQSKTGDTIPTIEQINLPSTQYLVRESRSRRSIAEGRMRTNTTGDENNTKSLNDTNASPSSLPNVTSSPLLDNVRFLSTANDSSTTTRVTVKLPSSPRGVDRVVNESGEGISEDDDTASHSKSSEEKEGNTTSHAPMNVSTDVSSTAPPPLSSPPAALAAFAGTPLFTRDAEDDDAFEDDDEGEGVRPLEQETLMHEEHVQILAKLRYVLEVVESLVQVAEKEDNPIVVGLSSSSTRKRETTTCMYRRAEQLVVYVRALHMLSQALLLAQRNVAAHTLHPSPAVQSVLNQLNDKYHQCLVRSQELASLGLPGSDPAMAVISAEKIMFKYAIDLCQAAALDELFGNPQLCSRRYKTAYMMLHTLSEQVQSEADKLVLSKHKTAVETRLRILEKQGFVSAVPSGSVGTGTNAIVSPSNPIV